jgi:glycosyltransferase involved in cell wall biosynthesis
MNILIINFEYPPLGGGGGVATQLVAEELAERHRIHVITTGFRGLKPRETIGGVVVHRVRVPGRRSLPTASLLSLAAFVPAALVRGWKLCRTVRFDVVNAQFIIPSGLVGVPLARLFGIPLVVSLIGGDLYDPSKGTSPHRHAILRFLVRQIARQAAALTAISEDTKRQAQVRHGVAQPITVVHLGIRPAVSSVSAHAKGKRPADAPMFVSIVRLIPRKNYQVLIRAWTRVPGAHLIILGGGPLLPQLNALVRELGLTARVQLRGFVAEDVKQEVLRTATGYVSAADHEGFGIVFLEAMEAGLPIVAVKYGGHTDFLSPEKNALLVEPNDRTELTQAVTRLLDDPALALRMGRMNKEKAKEFYLPRTAAAYEAVLHQAIRSYENRH